MRQLWASAHPAYPAYPGGIDCSLEGALAAILVRVPTARGSGGTLCNPCTPCTPAYPPNTAAEAGAEPGPGGTHPTRPSDHQTLYSTALHTHYIQHFCNKQYEQLCRVCRNTEELHRTTVSRRSASASSHTLHTLHTPARIDCSVLLGERGSGGGFLAAIRRLTAIMMTARWEGRLRWFTYIMFLCFFFLLNSTVLSLSLQMLPPPHGLHLLLRKTFGIDCGDFLLIMQLILVGLAWTHQEAKVLYPSRGRGGAEVGANARLAHIERTDTGRVT
jgi:hypothetical protein